MLPKTLATVALISGLLSPILAAPVDLEPGVSVANPLLAKRDCDTSGGKEIKGASMLYGSSKTIGGLTIEVGNDYCVFQDVGVTEDYFYGPYLKVTNNGGCESTLSIAKSKSFKSSDNRRSYTFYDSHSYVGCFAYSRSYVEYATDYYAQINGEEKDKTPIWERTFVIGAESSTNSLSESKASKQKDDPLLMAKSVKELKNAGVHLCTGKPNKKHPCKKHP